MTTKREEMLVAVGGDVDLMPARVISFATSATETRRIVPLITTTGDGRNAAETCKMRNEKV